MLDLKYSDRISGPAECFRVFLKTRHAAHTRFWLSTSEQLLKADASIPSLGTVVQIARQQRRIAGAVAATPLVARAMADVDRPLSIVMVIVMAVRNVLCTTRAVLERS